MIEGFEVDVFLALGVRQLSDFLLPLIRASARRQEGVPPDARLQLYLPCGIPFLSGTLGDFFAVPAFSGCQRVLYAVITRAIPDAFLTAAVDEVCDASTERGCAILSPVVASTTVGLSHVACLLGYLRNGGLKASPFTQAIATLTGFVPLISGLWRVTENHALTGRDVAAVTAPLHAFYGSLLPATVPPAQAFEYVLRVSTFVLHGLPSAELERLSLPLATVAVDAGSSDATQLFLSATGQRAPVLLWRPDAVSPPLPFPRKRQERPQDLFAIENAFSTLASFRPLVPLDLRLVTGVCIAEYTGGHTALFLSESNAKDAASAVKVDLLDPMTGRATLVDLEALARRLGRTEGGAMQLIDADKVRQVIQVCFDSSGSMGGTLAGAKAGKSDLTRITVATQYLTTFANRTYGYRVPCIQGLISFASEIVVRSVLSPLVPAFEDGIRRVKPEGRTRLWDALMRAVGDLVAFARPGGAKQFPNAALRILVISDGEDVGSTAKPADALQAMVAADVICDSVIISSTEKCKELCVVSHLTGGLSLRPATVSDCLRLFEEESFLCYDTRIHPARYRGECTAAVIAGRAPTEAFDLSAQSSTTRTANGRLAIAVPRYILYQNRDSVIPDARRRRILRELHQAAAVQDPKAVGRDPDGNEIELYDPDLKIYPMAAHFDQWRVYVKGCDDSPYEGKWWYIYVTFPDEYPVRPPILRFVSVPYHMNVSSEGRICLNVIEKGYMPIMPVVELLQTIKQLFLVPDTTTPLDIEKYFQYRDARPEYERLARESGAAAKNTVDEWIASLPVRREVEGNFSIVVGEQIPPYLRSAFTGKFIPKERRKTAPGGIVYDVVDLKTQIARGRELCPITGHPLITEGLLVD
jgi:ubiquitin-conjugating enzyme E2 D/E